MIRRATYYGAPNIIDQWKLLALVTMTIDHIGFFLFPDIMLFRAIGRASFPIWLFLVGYHAAAQPVGDWKKVKQNMLPLLIGSALILFSNVAFSRPIFPISVLLTILCVQAIFIFPLIRNAIDKQPLTLLVYVVITYPLAAAMEYGSLGLMFAILGYQVRNKSSLESIKITGFFSIVFYALISNLAFNFGWFQEYLVIGIVFWVTYRLAQWELKPWNIMQKKWVCFLTRNSLYYYVLHVLLLKALGGFIHVPEKFFDLKLFF